MQQKPFGKKPSGKHLERIKESDHYRDGSFQNLTETKMMADGTSYFNLLVDFFSKGINRVPSDTLSSVRTDLKTLLDTVPSIVWFGHSSYLIRIEGKNILVDPVFSQRASPVQYLGMKSYAISTPYEVEDLPPIDAVIITHDHYDHLDYNSIIKLLPTVNNYYTALGVGAHLRYWGVKEGCIHELDWWERHDIGPEIELIATPARHFSGRGFIRNKTFWASFVLKTDRHQIFIGGDSGYDDSFRVIGDKYGPFDIALLECGQYNEKWPYIHMLPEETVQASIDLGAKVLMPVHWGKFTLALHPWDEPIRRVVNQANSLGVHITTPKIGEPVVLNREMPQTSWWIKTTHGSR